MVKNFPNFLDFVHFYPFSVFFLPFFSLLCPSLKIISLMPLYPRKCTTALEMLRCFFFVCVAASFKRPYSINAPLQGSAYSKNFILFESVGWLLESYLVLYLLLFFFIYLFYWVCYISKKLRQNKLVCSINLHAKKYIYIP